MLTKREVTAFVEREENKALEAVRGEYKNHRTEEKNRIFEESGAVDTMNSMQRLMNQLVRENEHLNGILESAKSISFHRGTYGGLTSKLTDIQNIKQAVENRLDFESKELVRLKKKLEETERNVTANYAAVQAEVKNKTNARRAVDYLKELGFDVESLEQMQNTEIAVQLDKRYLFVGGGLR